MTAIAEIEARVEAFSATTRNWVLLILRALRDAGGSGSPLKIETEVGKMVAGHLSELQWAHVVRGQHVRWARDAMRKSALIGGEYGVWSMTPDGLAYLKRHANDPIRFYTTIPALTPEEAGEINAPLESVQVTDFQAFEIPILRVLYEGPVETSRVLAQIIGEFGPRLLPGDVRVTSQGRLVREVSCSRAIARLKQRGEAENEARGVWEITRSGRDRLDREGGTWTLEPYQSSHAKVRQLRDRPADPRQDSASPRGSQLPIEARWPLVRLHTGDDLFEDLTARLRPDLPPTPERQSDYISRNLILYGPPGTGKTFLAARIASALTGEDEPGAERRWRIVQFHPSYAYEDFVQGLKPDLRQTELRYHLSSGPFLEICRDAEEDADNFYALVIDEINRGDPARIFGELLYGLEYRGEGVGLALGGELVVPPNLIVLGTMNSVDRSVALIDYALRRRFAFVRVEPSGAVILRIRGDSPPLRAASMILSEFNHWIATRLGKEHMLGHSFFLNPAIQIEGVSDIRRIWRLDVLPLLEEYFFGDAEGLREARTVWDGATQRAFATASNA